MYLLICIERNNSTVAKMILIVNITTFTFISLSSIAGIINAAPNQPADKLINQSEIADNQNVSTNVR